MTQNDNKPAAAPIDEPANPYAHQGSLGEAWRKGFTGGRALAAPGSAYMRAYDEGKAARAATPAPSPADERAAQELLPIDRKWVTSKAISLVAEYRNCNASETEEVMQRFVDYMQAALQDAAARAASASETGAEGVKPTPYAYHLLSGGKSVGMFMHADDGENDGWRQFTDGSTPGCELIPMYTDPQPAMAAEAVPFEITEQAAAEWASRHDVDHVLKHFSTQRNAIEDARTLHLLDAAPQPAQADARVGLTDEQRDALNEAICWANDDGLPGTADQLRSILDAHLGQPEPRAEVTDAARDVLAERRRQIEQEGWTPEHDDAHSTGDMALAAACYAVADNENYPLAEPPDLWPWDYDWWKPTDERRNLVKAGALIVAEIERIDRAARTGASS